jgi:hypothetical protein
LGLTAGLVPPRVDAPVKEGLLDLVAHAHEHAGWSLRQSALVLGIEHTRLLRWAARAAEDRLADARPGPDVPVHALLDWEREAILKLAEDWAEIDRSHRKLAHRGSRLELVHVSESTVWRVLVAAGVILPAAPARETRVKAPWPDWAELVPGVSGSTTSPTSAPADDARSRCSTSCRATGCRRACLPRSPRPRSRSRSPMR